MAGSGTTTITETSTSAGDTITLLAGHAKVDTLNLTSIATATTVITDVVKNFALGQDTIKGLTTALTQGSELSAVKGVVASASYTAAADFITAVTGAAGTAGHAVAWYDAANNNTYVAEFSGAAGKAHIVELVGVHATAIDGTAAAGHVVIG